LGRKRPNDPEMTMRGSRWYPKKKRYPAALTQQEREMNRQAEASLDRQEAERRAGITRDRRLLTEPELPGVEDGINGTRQNGL
jgi:hypothetical protein